MPKSAMSPAITTPSTFMESNHRSVRENTPSGFHRPYFPAIWMSLNIPMRRRGCPAAANVRM